MSRVRLALLVVASAMLLLSAFVPVAEACCTPCTFCTKTTPPATVCCTGIPVPGDACGHTTCGKYLCGKRCAFDAPEAVAMTPFAAPQSDACQEALPFTAPAERPEPAAAPAAAVAAD
jgi:hypothetical protein